MKDTTKIKIYSKWELNKLKIIIFIIVLVVSLLFGHLCKTFKNDGFTSILNNTGLVGIIGSAVGALIGSIASFVGVIYTQRKQNEAQAMINKKNTIYRPLYDELVKVKKILNVNPYPSCFEFGNDFQSVNPHPQFGAWERIKSDSRRIQVPKYLDEFLEAYIELINRYLKLREKAADHIMNEINEIWEEKFNEQIKIKNLGSVLLGTILIHDEGKPLMKDYVDMGLSNRLSLNDEQLFILDSLIYDKCNNIDLVKRLKSIYEESLNNLDNIIDCLIISIDLINKKFEAYNHKYL